MIVQPKPDYFRLVDDRFGLNPASVKEVPSDMRGELFIECVVMDPPSNTGRTVYLHVPAEQVPAMLKAAKRAAIAARDQPERTTR